MQLSIETRCVVFGMKTLLLLFGGEVLAKLSECTGASVFAGRLFL